MIVRHLDGHLTWQPSPEAKEATHLWKLMQAKSFEDVDTFQAWSYEEHESFVQMMLQELEIRFQQPPTSILQYSDPQKPTWFAGAQFNIIENCFLADSQSLAIIALGTQGYRAWTYYDLYLHMQHLMNLLRHHGVQAGDRIAIYMPMTPESTALYLAILAMGASAVTIAESFSREEIKVRFDLTQPKYIFTQESMTRANKEHLLYEKIRDLSKSPIFVLNSSSTALHKKDHGWTCEPCQSPHLPYVYLNPSSESTILFSSGTTGHPKAIPWSHHTPLKCAFDGHLHQDIHEGERVCWPTSLGWMMGPWLVFATLINRGCICLYEDTPTQEAFGKFIDDTKVNILGLVPSLVSVWKESRCMESYSWESIKCFSSTGEASNPRDMQYLMQLGGGKPIIEYCGGTEIGGAYISSTLLKENQPGQFNSKAFGGDWDLFDESAQLSTVGEVFIKAPSIGLSTSLLHRDHEEAYFANTPPSTSSFAYRQHGDILQRTEPGYFRAQGRSDDSMNLGGIKVSSIQLEEIMIQCKGVLECAAISTPPSGGGPEQLVAYLVTKDDMDKNQLHQDCQDLIRQALNPLFKLQDIVLVDALPRTASNKVMRRELRQTYLQK